MTHTVDPTVGSDPRLLLLDEQDNVFVVRERIRAGETITVSGAQVTVEAALPLGHKIARRNIAVGEKIVKYGAPIGSATTAMRTGEHAHVHNIKSDYTPTYHLADVKAAYGSRE